MHVARAHGYKFVSARADALDDTRTLRVQVCPVVGSFTLSDLAIREAQADIVLDALHTAAARSRGATIVMFANDAWEFGDDEDIELVERAAVRLLKWVESRRRTKSYRNRAP